jgi:hypothetical protein
LIVDSPHLYPAALASLPVSEAAFLKATPNYRAPASIRKFSLLLEIYLMCGINGAIIKSTAKGLCAVIFRRNRLNIFGLVCFPESTHNGFAV